MKKVPLPKTRRSFAAYRDEHGVPHLESRHWLDALYGLGFMHAVDRGTQLLFARSVAAGRAAEEIAATPEMVDTDRFFRRVGLALDIADEVRLLDDGIFDQLTSYCQGVNDGLKFAGRSLPMWATGFQTQPWTQESVVLIGKLLSFGGLVVSQVQAERLVVELIHAGVSQLAMAELFGPRLDDVDFDLIRQVKMPNRLSDAALELISDLPRLAGSNAWAVSPRRSRSGKPLLASDPHLEVNRLPAIWYEAVLRWQDQFVMGATLPGCPLFAVARTNRLAWGVTYMKGDTVDHFIEDCRAGGSTGWQYRRGDSWHDFQVREDLLLRKGLEPETLRVLHNAQGTLESDPDELGAGYHLSLAWSGMYPGNGRAIGTWLDVIASDGVAEAMQAAQGCVQPTLSWIFADVDGHIGMQTCGRLPIRHSPTAGLAPIPAWDEGNHWQGWYDAHVLPSVFDPECGFVAHANQEVNPPQGPLWITQPLPDYRIRRISEVLSSLDKATEDDMQRLQYDVFSVQARDLLDIVLPELPEGKLKQRLSTWDLNYDPDSTEAVLFLNLYRSVMTELLGTDQGIGWRRMLYLCSRAGFSTMILTAADRLLSRDSSVWWHGKSKRQLIRDAAARIDADAEQMWSEINNFHFTDRFFGNHKVGRILGFNTRRYPMPGNYTTPFQGHVLQTAARESTFAPSYHFVTDLATMEAWTNLPGGPSENRFSKLYKADINRWLTGQYKRLALRG